LINDSAAKEASNPNEQFIMTHLKHFVTTSFVIDFL
jgi:hypothetical protein